MTELLYLYSDSLQAESEVIECDSLSVVLDKTIFYAQGGGQPADKGVIVCGESSFAVEDVQKKDGSVVHIGHFEKGIFSSGDVVKLIIDSDRRLLNSRLHWAGHLIDTAIVNLGLQLVPGKGYHYPEGAYVEYLGSVEENQRVQTCKQLEDECNRLIEKGNEVHIAEIDFEDVGRFILNTPDYIKPGVKVRVVTVAGKYGCPCGGTHVKNISEIKSMSITKIKSAGSGKIRVSYSVE